MIFTLTTEQQTHTYHLIERRDLFEGESITQFGIELCYFDECGHQVTLQIPNISDEIEIVQNLLDRLEGQDVDPITLEYIVEDYLAEIFGI